jgi:hypothetical protein
MSLLRKILGGPSNESLQQEWQGLDEIIEETCDSNDQENQDVYEAAYSEQMDVENKLSRRGYQRNSKTPAGHAGKGATSMDPFLILLIVGLIILVAFSADKAGCDKDGPHSPVE